MKKQQSSKAYFLQLRDRLVERATAQRFLLKATAKTNAAEFINQYCNFQGYSDKEIHDLEQDLNRKFPEAFKDFLSVFGKNMASLPANPYDDYARASISQQLLYPYDRIRDWRFECNPLAYKKNLKYLQSCFDQAGQALDDIIVFFVDSTEVDNDWVDFYYIRGNEGDNPIVYQLGSCFEDIEMAKFSSIPLYIPSKKGDTRFVEFVDHCSNHVMSSFELDI